MDSYTKCECGSGEKSKFCCLKAEAYIRKADRQIESKLIQGAITTLDEGLKKFPDTPSLIIRRAMLQTITGDPSLARRTLEAYLAKHPNHVGVRHLLIVNSLEIDGPEVAAIELQRFVSRMTDEQKQYMSRLAGMISEGFEELQKPLAALAHATLEVLWSGGQTSVVKNLMRLQRTPHFSYWVRHPWIPAEATDDVPAEIRNQFAEAHTAAMKGAWLEAAEVFGELAARDTSGLSHFNQGLCMAMIGENFGAVHCLRAYAATLGETERAVDIEALCQELDLPSEEDLIDRLQLTWPVRSLESLEKALSSSPYFMAFEPEDADGVPVKTGSRHFAVLNRPKLNDSGAFELDQVPRVVAYVAIDGKNASLTAPDDGVLDATTELFRETAGPAIVPAHPRTKHLGKVPKEDPMDKLRWVLPEGLSAEAKRDFFEERFAYDIENVWMKTPQKYLGRRTPEQASSDVAARVALRAALLRLSEGQTGECVKKALQNARAKLGLPEEPKPSTEAIDKINVGRLPLVEVNDLSHEQLVALFKRCVHFFVGETAVRAGEEWLSRPVVDEKDAAMRLEVYRELATEAVTRGELAQSLSILARGQAEDTLHSPDMKEAYWGMAAIRCKASLLEPGEWVPDLAVILDRKRTDGKADDQVTQTIFMSMMEMGLIRVTPDPDRPDQAFMDTRILEMLLQQYGPKITTATGELGISAAKPQIWTPGSAGAPAGGGSKIWTPGQSSAKPAASAEQPAPKLFVPGQ